MVGVSHPHSLNVFLGHLTSVISIPNYFFTSICPLLITWAAKFYLRSEKYVSYKFYAGYHQKRDFLEGISCLCVDNVMHVLDPCFFHIKSWCRKVLHM